MSDLASNLFGSPEATKGIQDDPTPEEAQQINLQNEYNKVSGELTKLKAAIEFAGVQEQVEEAKKKV